MINHILGDSCDLITLQIDDVSFFIERAGEGKRVVISNFEVNQIRLTEDASSIVDTITVIVQYPCPGGSKVIGIDRNG